MQRRREPFFIMAAMPVSLEDAVALTPTPSPGPAGPNGDPDTAVHYVGRLSPAFFLVGERYALPRTSACHPVLTHGRHPNLAGRRTAGT
jgi:hypothetical protein